jgi:hypothetical protein
MAALEPGGSWAAKQPQAKAPTWRGVGPWEEDWGELNAGKRPPSLFVLTVTLTASDLPRPYLSHAGVTHLSRAFHEYITHISRICNAFVTLESRTCHVYVTH